MNVLKDFKPRDVIVIVLLLLNFLLVFTGHQQLDKQMVQVEAQTARQCAEALR